jgi:nitrogen regulatory protein PII
MQNVKRLEIITDALEMREVVRVLEAQGVTGYTVIPTVVGKGERGSQSGDDLTDVFKNSLLITACEPSQVQVLVEAIRPILKRRGGVCLVSDAQWVVH